jgi:microcystin degradation protein MlrC
MIQTIRGQYKPVMAVRKPKVITPSVFQGTATSPALEIMERARIWEEEHPGIYVSVAFGFAYADVPDAGATVMVVANGDEPLAARVADDMSGFIWRNREAFAGKRIPKTQAGVARAIAAAKAKHTPVIVADQSDRTGGSTWILEELIRQGAERFCLTTLRDERALEALKGKKTGEKVSLALGGYSDKYAGNPVKITGVIEKIGGSEKDPIAVLKFGAGNRVILTPVLNQVTNPAIFDRLGIPLGELDIIVLKSRVHFRRGFADSGLAGAIIEVDAPGWGPADLRSLPYQNVPRDLYPLSEEKE